MNQEKLYESFGALDDAILERSERAGKTKKQTPWAKWCAAAACFAAVIIGAAAQSALRTRDGQRWPVKELQQPHREEDEEIAVVPKWEDMSISQQYPECEFAGVRYTARVTELSARHVAEALGSAALRGYDIYSGRTYAAAASLYGISGISHDCAVALRFDGRDEYYAYVNSYYQPDTLGQFTEDLELQKNLAFGSVWYNWKKPSGKYALVEFTGLDGAAVWEMLLSDPSLAAVKDFDSRQFTNAMSISIDLPLLGYQNISLGVTADGYLTTNILDTGKAFFIGEEAVIQFMDYVFNRCEGHEINYVGNAVPE